MKPPDLDYRVLRVTCLAPTSVGPGVLGPVVFKTSSFKSTRKLLPLVPLLLAMERVALEA